MWVIVLSDHLPVVALVSRYLANKLMGREPIPERKTLEKKAMRPKSPHPVLLRVSANYSELGGRLLTCYSPLRHCQPPEGGVSFDLHA